MARFQLGTMCGTCHGITFSSMRFLLATFTDWPIVSCVTLFYIPMTPFAARIPIRDICPEIFLMWAD